MGVGSSGWGFKEKKREDGKELKTTDSMECKGARGVAEEVAVANEGRVW